MSNATQFPLGSSAAALADEGTARRYVVLGAGRSGLAAARLLNSLGQPVLLCDEETPEAMDDQLSELKAAGISFQFGAWAPSILKDADSLVISPGVPLRHPMCEAARERSIPVIGELELGARMAQPPIFAITGTNGKTTTTSLISHILCACGYDAPSCGNIGKAFCDTMLAKRDPGIGTILVTEVSSFQLETTHRFHPAAAWVLNLTPDHLDRHGDMAGYQEAKYRISRNQQAGDALVLNADDPRVMPLADQAKADVWLFSRKRVVEQGAYVQDGWIMLRRGGQEPVALMPVASIHLPGDHNLENILAAAMVTFFCDLDPTRVAQAIRSFPGVEHRIEFVCEHEGVRYYNDSKATNIDALQVALKSFGDQKIVLLAGGQDTGGRFELLSDLVAERVRRVIAIGESAPRVVAAWRGIVKVERAESLFEACMLAVETAHNGEAVLLSPGCKSFDWFKNYEDRGRQFKATLLDIVRAPQA